MFVRDLDLTKPQRVTLAGCPAGHDARVLAELAAQMETRGLIHVALDDMRATTIANTLEFFAPDIEVMMFPAWDCLPYDRVSPNPAIIAQRIATLCRLMEPATKPRLILTTVNAFIQKVPPEDVFRQSGWSLRPGDECSLSKLQSFMTANGYTRAETVREPGEYAVRGGIIDLFPPGTDEAVRIDLFGDEIESLRNFDPLTQMTTGVRDGLALHPMSEIRMDEVGIQHFRTGYRELFGAINESDPLYEAISEGRKFQGMEHWIGLFYPVMATLLNYAERAAVTFDHQADEALKARYAQIEDFYQARTTLWKAERKSKAAAAPVYKPVPPERLYLTPELIGKLLAAQGTAQLTPFAPTEALQDTHDAGGRRGRDFVDVRSQKGSDLFGAFQKHMQEHQAAGKRAVLACYSQGARERLIHMAREHGVAMLTAVESHMQARKLDAKQIAVAILGLENGFVAPDLALVTEQDLLGDRLVRPARKKRAADQFRLELGALNAGDFVVHAEHGIGRYEGLETLAVAGAAHDCLKLVYAGDDKLYVPVENLDILSRYGSEEGGAHLDRLGGLGWQQRKSRVKKRLKDLADSLIKIAAARELREGEKIDVPPGVYNEFAARFPYAETEDQATAIDDVTRDLSSGRPMDRLICGDVGFGKTEIALRAAFLAAQAGLQVAVVVPTTLLARQHFQTFTRRFAGFPIRIAQLSRFVGAREAEQTKNDMKEGRVDIVVGTHTLLGKEIGFKRLGLIILDEEQHFGVKQKERLKEIRADVHVLTLTATPIPRTLQLALAGVRELSLITTPPVDRLAVRTFVLPFDPMVIREAIMREHYRGGQTFYVCPRIEDIARVETTVRELVPEVKIIAAHGRMSATQLEDIMTAFDAGQFDVLLSTNIVESGLDIPNANTLIIHRADMFGLAQLYQLRGRVGRSKQRAYAYLTYAAAGVLTTTAQQRLEVIQTLDQLGAGFQLASHDMDIRGAGNLLGEEQSGHIKEVGVELYQQMLDEAVAAAREGRGDDAAQEEWTPQINLGIPVLIPEKYVADLNVRLGLYRRLASLVTQDEIEGFAAELVDRFGPLPQEVENLLQTIAVKQICRKAGIAKVDVGPKGAVISFHRDNFTNPENLIGWMNGQRGAAKMRPDQKLVLIRAWDNPDERLNGLQTSLRQIADLAA